MATLRLRQFRYVWIVVRIVLAILLLCGSASADVGVSLFGQASRYADQPLRTGGLALELSIDRANWQYFTELAFGSTLLGDGDFLANTDGAIVRGAIGARYLARRFEVSRFAAFELGFEATVGVQDLEWRDADRDVRPEIGAGFNWNFEVTKWGFASRWSVRAFFAPSPAADQTACIGPCRGSAHVTSGYMLLMGVTW